MQTPAPLKGLIFTDTGAAMTPTATKKRGKLYRYYVSMDVNKNPTTEDDSDRDHAPVPAPASAAGAGSKESCVRNTTERVATDETKKEEISVQIPQATKSARAI
ncbi:MAG: hypothetical protein ACK5II_00285, partial [Paracoccus sp. (in: a-proteobacteria)]